MKLLYCDTCGTVYKEIPGGVCRNYCVSFACNGTDTQLEPLGTFVTHYDATTRVATITPEQFAAAKPGPADIYLIPSCGELPTPMTADCNVKAPPKPECPSCLELQSKLYKEKHEAAKLQAKLMAAETEFTEAKNTIYRASCALLRAMQAGGIKTQFDRDGMKAYQEWCQAMEDYSKTGVG